MSLKGIAKSTLEILDKGGYKSPSLWISVKEEQERAISETKLYTPPQLSALSLSDNLTGAPATVEVAKGSTQEIAYGLVTEQGINDLVLLNFASARNPGGGFVNGAKAQEEDLCRCSGLYPCLVTQPEYYEVNRKQKSLLYTDHLIYSPGVPWFRVKSRELLDEMFTASVITAPAPNAGQIMLKQAQSIPDIEASLRIRSGMILQVARDNGHRNILLGAWGCGVFRNNPNMVADAFGQWIESENFAGAFDRIVFGILDRSKSGETFTAFQQRFK